MKLSSPQFNTLLVFDEEKILTLVIESQPCLCALLADLTTQLEGTEGDTILSENDIPLPISKNMELIDNFFPFTLNRKTLLTKIAGHIEQAGNDEAHYLKTRELLNVVECYFDELSFGLPCELAYDKLNLSSLVKASGVTIIDDTPEPLEKLLLYMELVRSLDKDRLFVLLNFRCFFDDMQTEQFMQAALNHKYRVLMIEASDRLLLPLEKRLTIDKDRCEF